MSASLVGSEMCIRDSSPRLGICRGSEPRSPEPGAGGAALRAAHPALGSACLLYTSDAADDM
eukprot:1752516-Alexandrium_andersonii.AAC.1